MGFDENIEMVRLAFYQVLISSGPFLGAALAIGLLIGILQAATSIQEMTLSFVPKMVLVIFAMGFLANFFLVSLTDYFHFIFDTVSGLNNVYSSSIFFSDGSTSRNRTKRDNGLPFYLFFIFNKTIFFFNFKSISWFKEYPIKR